MLAVVAEDVVSAAGADSVVVASVVVALRAETIPVLKVQIIRLVRRMLAVENAITPVFHTKLFFTDNNPLAVCHCENERFEVCVYKHDP